MKLIVGLGNPGARYAGTRHNIGFEVIDRLAEKWDTPLVQSKFNGVYATVHRPEGKAILLKPLTYMNLSGQSVRPLMDYFDIDTDELTVIYDDLDLPSGQLRLRQKGSAGGHNGIRSLIEHLGTQQFNRIRIGVSRPPAGMRVPDYVLSGFRPEEKPDVAKAVERAAEACEYWLEKPYLEVMNKFNG
ncbi:aminoacyl-tRNA hydrolase [Indiicoccus explosivorum]|uniref:aminoacyl-tRNA hydrolase n=1 Tax=Indiicoccus explosivorum TaxID=1917864 RepID=UPI000B44EA06|nr:aminoacyl-tRNA hydrolase [Indiicoccus explosivorum]